MVELLHLLMVQVLVAEELEPLVVMPLVMVTLLQALVV